jgi:hypothetical protein
MAWWCDLHHESHKKLVHGFGEKLVRGVMLVPRETQRATLVEPKCEECQVVQPSRVLELVLSTPHGRVLLEGHH